VHLNRLLSGGQRLQVVEASEANVNAGAGESALRAEPCPEIGTVLHL
jgi:hypothetical protein